ncbi:hypothetical protein CO046_00965 [Candidatus Peregrinibacteria bacterium CG_4_9_14_0_2_um_filter_53_11]|nr:MAG: hypothetical protein CO046_00965 [Candidatus Peregrinibacteria bacterium CG_4_9_14_0_2_um_filter_53_11]
MADTQKIVAQGAVQGGSAEPVSSEQALTRINRDLEEKSARERAGQLKLPYIDVAGFPTNPDILHTLPVEEARAGVLMPFYKVGKSLRIAVADPASPETQRVIASLQAAGFAVELSLASAAGIADAQKLYASDQYQLKVEAPQNNLEDQNIQYEKELEDTTELKKQLEELPAEEGLNLLHVSAIKAGASDIHYEPEEKICRMRFRIDGILRPVFEISQETYKRLANQLKYKAGMKLNITSEPQDGRFSFLINSRKIDVRVSSIPLEYGESFVCRILDSGKKFGSFEELGFSGHSLKVLTDASNLAQGMVLVTGPTGSGKTTTLYVLLTMFNQPDSKVITLEDPIEYHLLGVTQSQINEKRGYTFSSGLRAVLRHDPDVVMIGEIRDLETAEVAVQAALTGHVLLSTLHTNSAIETVVRLTTMGVSPVMVAPALSILTAQRLVRRLCATCAQSAPTTAEERGVLEKSLQQITAVDPSAVVPIPEQLLAAKGCVECNGLGFRGQMVIVEVLHFDDELRQGILDGKSAAQLTAIARTKGMLSMADDGMLKVIAGQTTIAEVQRVTTT